MKGLPRSDPERQTGVDPLRNGVFAGKVLSNISGLRSSPKVTFFFFALLELYCSVFSTAIKYDDCLADLKQSFHRAEMFQGLFTDLNIPLNNHPLTKQQNIALRHQFYKNF